MKSRFGFGLLFLASALYGAEGDNTTLIVTIIVLAVVGVGILVYSQYQIKRMKKMHEEIEKKQMEMQRTQNELITNMSENIYDIAKEAIKNRNSVTEEPNERSLEKVLAKAINAENALLDMTNDLISFLKIRSKKVEIINERFNINNVLNELAGMLGIYFKESKVEVIFDINHNIPRYLIGDSLHLGQILNNLLEYSMLHTNAYEVKLEISLVKDEDGSPLIEFAFFDKGMNIPKQKLEKLFEPYYNEEAKEYVGLGLFVAKELAALMGGTLNVKAQEGRGIVFTLLLPMGIERSKGKDYELCDKTAKAKKVLIVDNHYTTALAVRKLFVYFDYDVNAMPIDDFTSTMPAFTEYDIVVLDEKLFTPNTIKYLEKTVDYLESIDKEHGLKIISMGSLMDEPAEIPAGVFDLRLEKPFGQERIFEALTELFRSDIPLNLPIVGDFKNEVAFVHKEPLVEAENVTRESFADFDGSRLLLVEDNLINQKVLINILGKSGIDITVANNGLEAVNIVTVEKQEFDLVLMDINMPIMDGYTATDKIRKTGEFDHLPIVAFTALVLDNEVQKMYNSGMNAFLSKPINMGKLYSVFELFLDIKMNSSRIQPPVEKPVKVYYGLDVDDGIKYANGDDAVYMEVLNEFLEAYGESAESFEKLVRENRVEQIKMLCLDMKGLTSAIGAYKMFKLVDEIHKLFIYNNQHLLHKYVESYTTELTKLKTSIDDYMHSDH